MKLVLAAICILISGCLGPVAGYNSTALPTVYETKNGGVNTGNRPRVTEAQVIQGSLYLY